MSSSPIDTNRHTNRLRMKGDSPTLSYTHWLQLLIWRRQYCPYLLFIHNHTFEHCSDVQSLCIFAHWSRFNLCLRLSKGFVACLRQRKPISRRRRKVIAVETSRPKAQLHFLKSWESWVADKNLLVLAIRQSCLSFCGVIFFCLPHAARPFKATALMAWETEALLQFTWLAMSFCYFPAAWRESMRLLILLRLCHFIHHSNLLCVPWLLHREYLQ